MKLTCKYSGVELSNSLFNRVDSLSKISDTFIHPLLLSERASFSLLAIDIKLLSINSTKNYRDELLILMASILLKSKLVIFDSPINPTSEFILHNYSSIKPILMWTNNLSDKELNLLPKYRITAENNTLLELDSGFCSELRNYKNSKFQQDLLSRQLKVLSYLEAKAKKRITYGKSPLNKESITFILTLASVPESDIESYLPYLSANLFQMANLDKPVVNLLDLEEYLELYNSQSLIKALLLKVIHSKLKDLAELGYSMPKEYFELDEESGEYIPKIKSSSASTFTFSVPAFDSTGKRLDVTGIKSIPRPIRTLFPDTLSYVRALSQWLKS